MRHLWNPAVYQGGSVSRRYFEGWYFKHVDRGGDRTLAAIPGISYSADGSAKHAFVQIVDSAREGHYFTYPAEEFSAEGREPFEVRIGENRFGRDGMRLRLADGDRIVEADLSFGPWYPWPVTLLSPGIMGWYRFVPGMQTYHAVLSMDHEVHGSFSVDGEHVSFDGGRGYVEKDWGRSFPSSWIWAQSNTFDRPGISLMLSVAKVPWMTGSFVGTIAGLLVDGELHRFATYTGARLESIETGANEAHIVLSDRREQLDVHLHGSGIPHALKAPVLGSMEGKDTESLGGTIEVTLRSLVGRNPPVLFSGTGRQAGIEVMNDLHELGGAPRVQTPY